MNQIDKALAEILQGGVQHHLDPCLDYCEFCRLPSEVIAVLDLQVCPGILHPARMARLCYRVYNETAHV